MKPHEVLGGGSEGHQTTRFTRAGIALIAIALALISACTGAPQAKVSDNNALKAEKEKKAIWDTYNDSSPGTFDWASNNGYDGPSGSGGAVQGSAATKWNPYEIKPEILGKPNPMWFGSFDFHDGGYYIRQYLGWKYIIAPKGEDGVSVQINDGLTTYYAKVLKISPYEIIIEHKPVPGGGFDTKRFVLDPSSTQESPKIQSYTLIDGAWISEDCWLDKTGDLPTSP